MSFPICNFRRPLRILLDDWDCTVPFRYPNCILDDAVITMVQFGKLNEAACGHSAIYTISPDNTGIDPDWSSNPTGYNIFALATYQTALMFLGPMRDKYSYKTRGVSESFGNLFRYVEKMEWDVHKLINGETLFRGYQSYYSWLSGVSGLPVGEILAEFNVESPLWKATFTRDGMRVA